MDFSCSFLTFSEKLVLLFCTASLRTLQCRSSTIAAGCWELAQCTMASMYLQGENSQKRPLKLPVSHGTPSARCNYTTEEKTSTDRHRGLFPSFQPPHRICRITSAGHWALMFHQSYYSTLLPKPLLNSTAVILDNF